LTGIWATAPYLHNGSVASLRQLLTPEDGRMLAFCVGNRAFDPSNVGFIAELDKNGGCEEGAYKGNDNKASLLDTTKFGNSNKGHSTWRHGVNLPRADKDALIEFLKTL